MSPAVVDCSAENKEPTNIFSDLGSTQDPAAELSALRIPERASEPARPNLPSGARFLYNGVHYCSRSEAACGALMERFIPGFLVKEGETFQVELGKSLRGRAFQADFMVNGVIVEYHPPRFYREGNRFGDFDNAREYFEYQKHMRSLHTSEQKARFKEHVRDELADKYHHRRRVIIDRNAELRGSELIVATTAEDFFQKVITRFAKGALPSEEQFAEMFRKIQGEVVELHGGNFRYNFRQHRKVDNHRSSEKERLRQWRKSA